MTKQVLFIQGAGEGAYEEDARLVASLRSKLGSDYAVRYPRMPNDGEADFEALKKVIGDELAVLGDGAILVGHSVGGSVVLRVVVDGDVGQQFAGIFVLAAPFWHDHEFWHSKDVELPKDAARRIPTGLPLFLYHGREDEFVPFSHVEMYARALPQATVRRLDGRNHQLNDDLTEVAQDIARSD